MTVQWQITGDVLDALNDQRIIHYLMLDDTTVETTFEMRVLEMRIPRLSSTTPDDVSAAWSAGTAVPGTALSNRILWFQHQQKSDDAVLGATIAAVFNALQGGGSLSDIVTAGLSQLAASDFQMALYTALYADIDAAMDSTYVALTSPNADKFYKFVALAMVVAYGKIGQPKGSA